jgi:hypothetical protein
VSLVGVNKLVRSVERRSEAVDLLRSEPESLLARYELSAAERDAVLDLDAATLVELGVNPLLMRTLLVAAGVPNSDLFHHDLSLRTRQSS